VLCHIVSHSVFTQFSFPELQQVWPYLRVSQKKALRTIQTRCHSCCAALKGTQSLVCSWSIKQLTAKRWDAVAGCPKPILIFSRRCVTFAWCCHTHTHDHFTALFPGPPGWAGARSELLDFIVQGKINRGRHTDHPTGCHSIRTNQCPPPPSPYFLQAGCPSCRPTNSVKALKATWCRHSQTILPMLDSQVMSPQEIARTG